MNLYCISRFLKSAIRGFPKSATIRSRKILPCVFLAIRTFDVYNNCNNLEGVVGFENLNNDLQGA